ncbi:antitoxin Xre/MbcA/ParS toxin-binding domain-containing protein [Castellaniella caeni]|uniref:antitoxin Xre/MbcA/ParS toxin-binding domain-containing protein n=1 Tax=Castellaniella caeni TaxID=266123 RepID=UPI00082BE5F0|nr:antitoxin Xre/MbcA/ParS toxin-binding domain-containing protein [Castellaniella caeni]
MYAEVLRPPAYAAYRSRLSALLGIPDDASEIQIHERIVQGFPADRLIELCEQGDMSPTERDQIIPLRTLKNRLEKSQPLTVAESDRLFRAAHITAMAETIFRSRDKARRWLNKPKTRFDGHSPVSMLASLQGTRQVEEMLIQLAEGYSF